MPNLIDTRWRQRFSNLLLAFKQLSSAIKKSGKLSDLEKEGMIQRFEYTFELTWKTLKDFLSSKGVEAAYPRDVLKEAFSYGIIENGEVWIEMLEKRNEMAHTYESKMFKEVVRLIEEEYYVEIERVVQWLIKQSKS